MLVEAQLTINGTKAETWAAVADIEHAAQIVSGIEKIEIIEKPPTGLVGLRWRETRILFGEPATVEKWVTEAAENEFYRTRAEDKGFVFLTTIRLEEGSGGTRVSSSHDSLPQTLAARLQAIPMALFFKGAIRKAIMQDLADIKAAVERP
ncbi:SRPBCC family protein [Pseudoduganella violaceinigra]|uniref:SRPBCC family protein n=1 Tax=Pseudoduganella violaceinigra TaxID=246602 RepID=UPI000413FF81|nr:SRPBCC family protein [Pseudoduganella violaceinigra]